MEIIVLGKQAENQSAGRGEIRKKGYAGLRRRFLNTPVNMEKCLFIRHSVVLKLPD